jgi:cytidylate kinase
MGCGGEKIAKIVAEKLNLKLYDDPQIHEEAIKMGIRPEELKNIDEKAPGFFDSLWRHNPQMFIDLLESVVYGVARKGEGVIIGHGSQILLRDFGCAMHVLIYASEPFRVQQVMSQRGLSKEAAGKLTHKNDHERKGFMKYAFHMDWTDISLYDLVINPGKIGFEGAAQLIVEAAASPEVKECSITALDTMDRLSLAKKIEAELMRNDFNLTNFSIEVEEKGHAHITGFASSKEEKLRLVEAVKKVSGVTEVETSIGTMRSGMI